MIGSDKKIESGRGHRIQEPAILVLNHHGTKRLLMIHAHRIVITQVTVGNEGGPSPSHRRLQRIQHGRSNEAKRKGVRVDERVEGYHRHDTATVGGQTRLQRKVAVPKITTKFWGYRNEPVRSRSKRLTANWR